MKHFYIELADITLEQLEVIHVLAEKHFGIYNVPNEKSKIWTYYGIDEDGETRFSDRHSTYSEATLLSYEDAITMLSGKPTEQETKPELKSFEYIGEIFYVACKHPFNPNLNVCTTKDGTRTNCFTDEEVSDLVKKALWDNFMNAVEDEDIDLIKELAEKL